MTQQATIHLIPFNRKKHRHLMPFAKGQGVSLAGWQFQIVTVHPNGRMVLECKGKILGDEDPKAKPNVPLDPVRLPIKTTAMPCMCRDKGHGLLDPEDCPVHGPNSPRFGKEGTNAKMDEG
jgi:hypothetical protein